MGDYQGSRIARHVLAVQERADSLRSLLKEYACLDYPDSGIAMLLESLLEVTSAFQGEASDLGDAARELFKEAAGVDEIHRLLHRIDQALKEIHECTSYLRESDVYTLPMSLSEFIASRIRRAVPSVPVSFHATAHYNFYYMPLGAHLNANVFGVSSGDAALDESFSVLAFPKSEYRNTLTCCLLAHEAGHFLFAAKGLWEAIKSTVEASGGWGQVEALIDSASSGWGQHLPQIEDQLRLWQALQRWVQEYAADRIAVYLVGPAFYIAWVDFKIGRQNLNRASLTHPSPANRMAVLWRFLTEGPWHDLISGRMTEFIPWLQAFSGDEDIFASLSLAPKTEHQVLNECMKQILPHVCAAVDSLFDPLEIQRQVDDYTKYSEPVFELMDQGVPPGEVMMADGRMAPVPPEVCLLAGWVFLLTDLEAKWGDLGNGADGSPHTEIVALLNDHLDKAIEISRLRSAWEATA